MELYTIRPQAGFFSDLRKKLRLLFGLDEKHQKRAFLVKKFTSYEIYS